MANTSCIEIKKFNAKNFEPWKLKMKDLLIDRDQWVAVKPGANPTGMSQEEWDKLDRKSRSSI